MLNSFVFKPVILNWVKFYLLSCLQGTLGNIWEDAPGIYWVEAKDSTQYLKMPKIAQELSSPKG